MRRNATSRSCREQRGISLVVGLIMLVLMTLLAISAFQASNVNLRIAGNMQVRQETLAAAQTATEQMLSSPAFIDPATPPAATTVTLNGADYIVNFTPAPFCKAIVDIPSEELEPKPPETCKSSKFNEENCKCIISDAGKETGIFPPTVTVLCANTRWSVIANVADANTGADTTLEHGISIRVAKEEQLDVCP